MIHDFQPGDFLIFQLESGFGLLRVLAIETDSDDMIWHLSAFKEFFLDIDAAEMALQNPSTLSLALPHVALTNRAFESTQVSRISTMPLSEDEVCRVDDFFTSNNKAVSDRSIRLLLGLR